MSNNDPFYESINPKAKRIKHNDEEYELIYSKTPFPPGPWD